MAGAPPAVELVVTDVEVVVVVVVVGFDVVLVVVVVGGLDVVVVVLDVVVVPDEHAEINTITVITIPIKTSRVAFFFNSLLLNILAGLPNHGNNHFHREEIVRIYRFHRIIFEFE